MRIITFYCDLCKKDVGPNCPNEIQIAGNVDEITGNCKKEVIKELCTSCICKFWDLIEEIKTTHRNIVPK